MQYFQCCMNCKPPKRNANCHSICEEYIKSKEKYNNEVKINAEKYRKSENDFYNARTRVNRVIRNKAYRY